MPISGLVVTLVDDVVISGRAVLALERSGCVELGVREGRRLPLVLDTASEDDNRREFRWLSGLPGVEYIDVVFVSISDSAGGCERAADPRAGELVEP